MGVPLRRSKHKIRKDAENDKSIYAFECTTQQFSEPLTTSNKQYNNRYNHQQPSTYYTHVNNDNDKSMDTYSNILYQEKEEELTTSLTNSALNSSTNSSTSSPYTDRFFPSRKTSDLKYGFQSPPSPVRTRMKQNNTTNTYHHQRSLDFSTVTRLHDPSRMHPTNLFSSNQPPTSSMSMSADNIHLNMTYPSNFSNTTTNQRLNVSSGVIHTDHLGSTYDGSISSDDATTNNPFAKNVGSYQDYLRSEFQYRDNLLSYRNTSQQTTQRSIRLNQSSPSRNSDAAASNANQRKIPTSPIKLLDAPNLQDDFYLNLVDWGKENVLSVGLYDSVYLWNASNAKVLKLCTLRNNLITSVSWNDNGNILAVGNAKGTIELWDVTKSKCFHTYEGHTARVGCLSWNANFLSSGSRDNSIIHRDMRQASSVFKLQSHKQEVCGLKWSPDGNYLASGGNDNKLFVWQPQHKLSPSLRFADHRAAVKGIAWSPHQHGLLASGGGTADRCIRFWNVVSGQPLHYVDTGSQVCNIAWSKNVNELVSTHGFSQNQIVVWDYPTMTSKATLTGHSLRVLYLSVSPDGQTIVTGAGDETLRIWNVFPPASSTSSSTTSSSENY
eukprot:CAMPEP_0117431406 /NCGR_PEP_ID=MMETSP0758-20121206/10922_1 /TAXON_ID=63605 /ORGANISM="Percolomonas cosmopolitus, Strain AE-1 (ATCC 50343)" /LENGTH=608 /DNA_ID=CAMNT_0005220347 /DNA_START=248 /DNA_END=2071 /DNA_ORIENTATION=-